MKSTERTDGRMGGTLLLLRSGYLGPAGMSPCGKGWDWRRQGVARGLE